ncbi:MAG: DnaJ domain-containing protein [Hydrogenothermaceae bacterium]
MNFFRLLGVSPLSSTEEIKKAFYKKAKKFHPDLNPNAGEIFKYITQAYETLTDPEKRKHYESVLNKKSILDKFSESFFGFLGFTAKPKRGKNIKLTLTVYLEDGLRGSKKEISYKRKVICGDCDGCGFTEHSSIVKCEKCINGYIDTKLGKIPCPECLTKGFIIKNPCNTCKGIGYYTKMDRVVIDIPVGVRGGDFIKIEKIGNAGLNGGDYGDLIIKFRLDTSPFEISGNDLILKMKLEKHPSEYSSINLKLPSKEKITVNMPNIDPPFRLVVRNCGYTSPEGDRGNLYIDIT